MPVSESYGDLTIADIPGYTAFDLYYLMNILLTTTLMSRRKMDSASRRKDVLTITNNAWTGWIGGMCLLGRLVGWRLGLWQFPLWFYSRLILY